MKVDKFLPAETEGGLSCWSVSLLISVPSDWARVLDDDGDGEGYNLRACLCFGIRNGGEG